MRGIWGGIMIPCPPIAWQIGCVQEDQKLAILNFLTPRHLNTDIRTWHSSIKPVPLIVFFAKIGTFEEMFIPREKLPQSNWQIAWMIEPRVSATSEVIRLHRSSMPLKPRNRHWIRTEEGYSVSAGRLTGR